MSLRCIIDVEASGFGTGSYPIEVGTVLPCGRSYCALIHPEPDWTHWEASAEGVHGITRGALQAHGKSAATVARQLNECLRGQTVYTDAWYHDYQWLARLFDAANLQPAFKLQDLRTLLSEEAKASWQSTREAVAQELQLNRHRASNDARVLQRTLQRVTSPADTPPHHPGQDNIG
ncbi:MAG: 3'-5' exoribonuclease [Burkholderiaceae bacterium]|nr:3'-5' exoribonuclease [Burkholderiaceae bacterium]MDZ4161091.1 3'-5' exoribonuclease [Burkholderiales bacterium]